MHRLIFGVISFAALALVGCAGMSPASYGSGWTELLNGPRGFDENWTRIGEANWRIVDGIAQADAGKKGENSYLMTKKAYGDFMLRAEFWVSDDANSGIYMRCPDCAPRSPSMVRSGGVRRRQLVRIAMRPPGVSTRVI